MVFKQRFDTGVEGFTVEGSLNGSKDSERTGVGIEGVHGKGELNKVI